MQVQRVNPGNRRDVERFLSFPYRLYQDCPFWVPPLISASRECLLKNHPFFQHSEAAFYFVESGASEDILGRLAVMNNRRFNVYRKSRTAFFSMFEAANDRRAAGALFDAAFDWARRENLTEMIGPRGFSAGDGAGILVDGFSERAIMGIPYNYPYYEALLEDVGFQKETDYLSGFLNRDDALDQRYHRVAGQVKARRGFKIKHFHSNREIRKWSARILEVHHRAFARNHTYCPPTGKEAEAIINTILMVSDHRLVKLVLKDEQIIGFLLVLPDLSLGLQSSRGRLWPWGWFHLLREKRRTRRISAFLLGVVPEYRGWGVTAVLYSELAAIFFKNGYEHLELVTLEENNRKTVNEHQALGTHWYKCHRGYRRAI